MEQWHYFGNHAFSQVGDIVFVFIRKVTVAYSPIMPRGVFATFTFDFIEATNKISLLRQNPQVR